MDFGPQRRMPGSAFLIRFDCQGGCGIGSAPPDTVEIVIGLENWRHFQMKYSTAILVLLIFAAAGSAIAQRKTVTNADLEKYRQARLDAEREYRENHARLGLPSPEELAKRNEASTKESMELSAKLREQEIERERMRLNASSSASPAIILDLNRQLPGYRSGIAPTVYSEFYGFGRSYRPRGIRQPIGQQYYVSGGSLWPVGPRTPSRPMFRLNRR